MSLLDLIAQIEKLPLKKQTEVEDFVDFLVSKTQRESTPERTETSFGSFKGKIIMSGDVDEPLEDFKEYMYL